MGADAIVFCGVVMLGGRAAGIRPVAGAASERVFPKGFPSGRRKMKHWTRNWTEKRMKRKEIPPKQGEFLLVLFPIHIHRC